MSGNASGFYVLNYLANATTHGQRYAQTKQVPRSRRPQRHPFYDALFGPTVTSYEPGTATGTPGNWWTVFAQVPDCLHHMVAGFQFIATASAKFHRDCANLTSPCRLCRGSQFVFSQHCKALRAANSPKRKSRRFPIGRPVMSLMRSSVRFWPIPTIWCCKVVV